MESGSGSLEALREANRLRVIDALRHEGSASRTDLVRITGLSRTTITTLVGDLQERGLVVELEEDAADRPERPGRGRPPVLLRPAPSPTSPRPYWPNAAWTSTSTPLRRPRWMPPPSW